MKHEIYRLLDADNFCDAKTGEAIPYLSYDGKVYGDAKVLSRGGLDATLEELVQLCDHDAEDRNAHDFCGAHRLLGALLFRRYGRESATMREIAMFGGLQGMGGVCTEGDAYKELGVGRAGHDWNGKYDAEAR
jgi:hypothetical protein